MIETGKATVTAHGFFVYLLSFRVPRGEAKGRAAAANTHGGGNMLTHYAGN